MCDKVVNGVQWKCSTLLCALCLWMVMKVIWLYKQCYILIEFYYHTVKSWSITIEPSLKNKLAKIPKHMAICIGLDDCSLMDMNKLIQIIHWCDAFDIQTLTIYHYSNLLVDYGHLITANKVQVQLISLNSSHQSVIETARHICRDNMANGLSQPITVNQIDEHLRSNSYRVADPELLICFSGQWTLQAFPPWQIRLTEIVFLPSHRLINESLFLQQIKRYSKCVQRFGQ